MNKVILHYHTSKYLQLAQYIQLFIYGKLQLKFKKLNNIILFL